MWGPVPLLTDEDADNYFNSLPSRASVTEVYKLIESDFREAIEKLPLQWESSMEGRPTRDAAKGLLAKVYLTMATAPMNDASYYPKAAEMAKEVIEAGNYSLVDSINQVFTMETKYGPEI